MFDSTDKLKFYLSAFCAEPYDGIAPPAVLAISHTFWRDYTCPPGCGGCCKPFSMDLSEDYYQILIEKHPEKVAYFDRREIDLFGTPEIFYSNTITQKPLFDKGAGQRCQFLDGIGRCGIYHARPLPCRMELNKFIFRNRENKILISKKLFGRGWGFARVDGGRGALCEMIPVTKETVEIVKTRDIPLFERLIKLLDDRKLNHKGHLFLDILEGQYQALMQDLPIKSVTVVERTRKLF